MKKLLLFAGLFASLQMTSQIWSENFNAATGLPTGWTQLTAATDGGWAVNTATGLSSTYFTVPTADGKVIGTNDDACDCDKSNDFIMSPAIDLTGASTPYLLFDYFYFNGTYNGSTEVLTLEVSTDGGTTWAVVQELAGVGAWTNTAVSMTAYAGQTVQFGLRYNDDAGWMFGVALDNFQMIEPDLTIIDAIVSDAAVGVENPAVPTVNFGYSKYISGEMVIPFAVVSNNAFSEITSFDVSYTYNGNTVTDNVTGQNLGYGQSYVHQFAPVNISQGANDFAYSISNVNNGAETVSDNNAGASSTIEGVTPFPGRLVIGEYGTGTWCGWCVRSHIYNDYLTSIYPENFLSIAVHNSDPMVVTEYDAAMANVISGYPSGTVDRATFNGGTEVDPSDFEAALLERVYQDPGVLVQTAVDYTDGASNATIVSNFNFTQAMTGTMRVAVILVEDGVTGTGTDWDQVNYYSGGGSGPMGGYENLGNPVSAAEMTYNHVARALYGTYAGSTGAIANNPTAGTNASYATNVTIDPTWNLDNVRAVTLLIKGGQIINAGVSGALSTFIQEEKTASEFNVYPNPANEITYIRLSNNNPADVNISILDATGRVVANQTYKNLSSESIVPFNTSAYTNGLYTVRVESNGTVSTRTLVVNK